MTERRDPEKVVREIIPKLKEAGARASTLPVSAPFHSTLMQPAEARLREDIERISFSNPCVPVYVNVDAKPITDAAAAKAYVRARGAPIVVKADGLAAGKGVIVAQTVEEALDAVDLIMVDKEFKEAGDLLVVGAGMAGSMAAIKGADLGLNTIVADVTYAVTVGICN